MSYLEENKYIYIVKMLSLSTRRTKNASPEIQRLILRVRKLTNVLFQWKNRMHHGCY